MKKSTLFSRVRYYVKLSQELQAYLAKYPDRWTDYQDEFKTIPARFAKHLSSVVPVRFDERTLHQLRNVAYQRGIGPTTLIRMWVLERMHGENKYSRAVGL